MATKKQEAPAAPESRYPAIEAFAERAKPDEVAAMFAGLKTELANLKGPKAEQAKKISKAVERTEELLQFLIQVREKLESERKGKK
jgi:hypothetical protein